MSYKVTELCQASPKNGSVGHTTKVLQARVSSPIGIKTKEPLPPWSRELAFQAAEIFVR